MRDQLVPVVGLVNMDLISVDLTGVPDAAVGAEVILLENSQNSPLSVTAWAKALGTIPYEVLTSISDRVERIYV